MELKRGPSAALLLRPGAEQRSLGLERRRRSVKRCISLASLINLLTHIPSSAFRVIRVLFITVDPATPNHHSLRVTHGVSHFHTLKDLIAEVSELVQHSSAYVVVG